jgi:hypothetical protein
LLVRAALLLLVALPIAPAVAQVFVLTRTSSGTPLRWRADPVPFVISSGGSVTLPASERARALDVRAVRRAFQTWEAVALSKLRFTYRGLVAPESVPDSQDGVNSVSFFAAAIPPELIDTVAVTSVVYSDRSGQILDADIYVNERDFRFSTFFAGDRVDLESVILHEVGHLLGLDHTCGVAGEVAPSCDDPALVADPSRRTAIFGSVMFPTRGPGEALRRALTRDDELGVEFLYPAPAPMPGPQVTGVEPRIVRAAGALSVSGASFEAGAKLRVGRGTEEVRELTVGSIVANRIEATFDPAGLSAGCFDVIVENPSGKSGGLFGVLSVGGAPCADPAPSSSGCAVGSTTPDGTFSPLIALVVVGMLFWMFVGRRRRAGLLLPRVVPPPHDSRRSRKALAPQGSDLRAGRALWRS